MHILTLIFILFYWMSTQTGISTVAKFLLKELQKRFVHVDPSSPTFDAVYLAATPKSSL